MRNDIAADLKKIALQEAKLQFENFDVGTAWEIGTRIKALLERKKLFAVIDVYLHNRQVFFCALPNTTPDNAEWVRRKRNVTLRLHKSSYAVGLELRQNKMNLQQLWGVNEMDYAAHGGCFPVVVRGTGCVGCITVSGLPSRQDHGVIVEVLSGFLGFNGLQLKP